MTKQLTPDFSLNDNPEVKQKQVTCIKCISLTPPDKTISFKNHLNV